jgi:AraC-like DNA-binding protein
MAARLHLSRTMLNRLFGDITPAEFINRMKTNVAKRMLRETNFSTTRIAYCAGFGTRRTFYRAFKRATGLTPDAYRRGRQNVSRHPQI